jgi:uncharacterized integral membrane protein
MWVIKWFFAVVLILVFLGFALYNRQEVTVIFLSNVLQFDNVQLWMVIYAAFGLGVMFWLVVSIFQVLQLKNEMRKLKRANNEMQRELDSLRNLPIGEDDPAFDIKEDT